jgi:uncharacterized protein (TIGR02145 family)
VPVTGAGYWSIKSGASGSFADSTVSNTIFTGVLDNKYVLTWTISNECNSGADEVKINFYDPARIGFDVEGNVYYGVQVGTQIWMAENLKTTKYNDGTDIPLITDNAAWTALSTPGYCWYNNDSSNKDIYGALYNWYTVNTGKLCPSGTHVPSDSEWKILEMYIGMTPIQADATGFRGALQGLYMKYTSGWHSGRNGTNITGFSALPGGYRLSSYNLIGSQGFWWSSTEYNAGSAWFRMLDGDPVYRSNETKTNGLSVRCIVD